MCSFLKFGYLLYIVDAPFSHEIQPLQSQNRPSEPEPSSNAAPRPSAKIARKRHGTVQFHAGRHARPSLNGIRAVRDRVPSRKYMTKSKPEFVHVESRTQMKSGFGHGPQNAFSLKDHAHPTIRGQIWQRVPRSSIETSENKHQTLV